MRGRGERGSQVVNFTHDVGFIGHEHRPPDWLATSHDSDTQPEMCSQGIGHDEQ